ncbi:hypothetical protein D3C78_1542870 [compost metagenome]
MGTFSQWAAHPIAWVTTGVVTNSTKAVSTPLPPCPRGKSAAEDRWIKRAPTVVTLESAFSRV